MLLLNLRVHIDVFHNTSFPDCTPTVHTDWIAILSRLSHAQRVFKKMKIFSRFVKDFSSTIGERNEIDDSITLLIFTQTILGQQVLNLKWSWRSTAFRHIFCVLLMVYVCFGTADVLEKVTDASSKAEGYYTFLICNIFLFKYGIFVTNRDNFRKVYLMAKVTLFEIIKNTAEDKSSDLVAKIKIIVKVFFVTILVPIVMYILIAMWCNMHGERVTLSKMTSILMPMTTPYYEIGFVLHVIYLFLMAFTICVIDVWFVIIMLFFCVSCDCLVEILKVEPKTSADSDLEYAVRLNDTLRRYYTRHTKLMEYLNILCDMYKWAAVVPLVSVLFAVCLLMFVMSEQVQWNFLANFVPTIAEIFAYNWFGEQLKQKTKDLESALLNFDWPGMRLADRKNYLIILTYMQKEFCIKTAFGNDLSLSTMTDVLKAGYQAFTLLKTMDV